jgi:virginiamycin B lyase
MRFATTISLVVALIAVLTSSCALLAAPTNAPPYGVTSGPDGNVWFTRFDSNRIGRLTTNGRLEGNLVAAGGFPSDIVAGPDGAAWFTDFVTNRIGRMSADGKLARFDLPAGAKPDGVVSGPDANLWFAESGAGKIGRITLTGVVTEFGLPHADSSPLSITVGPDQNLLVHRRQRKSNRPDYSGWQSYRIQSPES